MGEAEDSILQVCQLTELKLTKERGRYSHQLLHLYETLLPENLGKHCLEWPAGKPESGIKFPIHENLKPQDLMAPSPKTSQGWASLSSEVRPPSRKTVPSLGLPQEEIFGRHMPLSS